MFKLVQLLPVPEQGVVPGLPVNLVCNCFVVSPKSPAKHRRSSGPTPETLARPSVYTVTGDDSSWYLSATLRFRRNFLAINKGGKF